MGRKRRFTAAQVANALTKTRGMIYLAAESLECSHTTINNYVNRYKSVKEAKEHARGKFKDIAEIKLIDAVREGEAWAIKFTLQMLGGDRGYAPKQKLEHTGKGGGPLVFKEVVVELPPDEDMED